MFSINNNFSSEDKIYFKLSILSGGINVIGTALILLISLPLLINNLGIEKYGIFSLIFIFIGIGGILNFGLNKLLIYSYSQASNINPKFVLIMYIYYAVIIIILIMFLIFFYSIINLYFFQNTMSLVILHESITYPGIILMILELLCSLLRSDLEANYKIRIVNYIYLFQTFSIFVGVGVISFFTTKLWLLYIYIILIYKCVLIFLIFKTLKYKFKFFFKPSINDFIILFKSVSQFIILDISNSLLIPISRYLIYIITGPYTAGIFDLTLRITGGCQSLLISISKPLFVFFAKNNNLKQSGKVIFYFSLIIFLCYLIGILIFPIIFQFANIFLKIDYKFFNLIYFSIIFICLFSILEPITNFFMALNMSYLISISKLAQITFFVLIVVILENYFVGIELIYLYSISYLIPFVIILFNSIIFYKQKNN